MFENRNFTCKSLQWRSFRLFLPDKIYLLQMATLTTTTKTFDHNNSEMCKFHLPTHIFFSFLFDSFGTCKHAENFEFIIKHLESNVQTHSNDKKKKIAAAENPERIKTLNDNHGCFFVSLPECLVNCFVTYFN